MVQALNLILLASSELSELRGLLKQSLVNAAGKDLFLSLYASWCHSPMAIISLCLLAQTYQHASSTPMFAYLRLQLLEPGRYIWLLKALYGLLMLLPQQSKAFKILRTRLKTVPSYSFNGEQFKQTSSANSYSQIHQTSSGSPVSEDGAINEDSWNVHNGINFASRLQQFEDIQQLHRMHHSKSQAQSCYSSSSAMERYKDQKSPSNLRLCQT
ncbi:hypothetical protein F0562_033512 [Nyssa sinensis]|uniref:Vacuolar protein 14 C-terminal Fig4-binding domain-containing protein n=1 Tax=Nyssa sinensis TaxID=561372 RepID=A0A5J5AEL3_9ASTE|nr:hypothetical protein F0562_033512 [Nyssa sinensis]